MSLTDDGDLIRGLGYVALYAAYLEEAICRSVTSHDPTAFDPPDSASGA